jgi:hypothetical protein
MEGHAGALTERPLTERPSDILTRTEHPLNIWSTVTFGPCNILTPIHNIQRFYVHPPPQKLDVMSLVTSCPPLDTWPVTFGPHFPVVFWVELSQLTWNYLDMSP